MVFAYNIHGPPGIVTPYHIVPVILGGGIPMLSCSMHLSRFELADATAFPNGVVKVVYTRAQRPWRNISN